MWQYIVVVNKNLLMRLFTKLWVGLRETTKDAAAPPRLATEKKILITLGWRSNLPDLERLGSTRHACMLACLLRRSVVPNSVTLWTAAPRLHCSWDCPGKNSGVSCHFLLQGIFLTQGLNQHLLCLLHCRQILYLLSHWGSPCRTWAVAFNREDPANPQ